MRAIIATQHKALVDTKVRNAPVSGTEVGVLRKGTTVTEDWNQDGWLKFSDVAVSNKPDKQWVALADMELVSTTSTPPPAENTVDFPPGTAQFLLKYPDGTIRKFQNLEVVTLHEVTG